MRWTSIPILIIALGAPVAGAQEPARTDGWVVLSLDEYRTLRARAFPAPITPAPPPVDAALTRVDYDLRANVDTISGEARLTVDVLKQGWVSIQAPSGVLVRAARLDGRPVALVAGSPPRVLVSRTGRSTLTLDIVVPIASSSGAETMTLPASGSAVSSVRLTIPRTGVDLSSTGGIVTEQTEASGETRWSVYGAPGRPITFSWKRRSDDRRATMPLRARARLTSLVALGEENSHITTSVTAEIVQGAARGIALTVPEGVTVNQVSGATVADWNHEAGTLTVSFLEPLMTQASFVISAEARTPRDGAIAIPILRMPGSERETGGVAVDVVGTGEIGDPQPRGMDPADPSELGDIVGGRESPSMAAFRFRSTAGSAPRALNVRVTRYTPRAVLVANIEEARYEALVGEDGKTLVRARFAVRNNQRSFLAVALPAGATLWSAALGSRPVRPGLSPSGNLLLPLQKARGGESPPVVPVEIVYLERGPAWANDGSGRLSLAAVDLPISRTGVLVRYSPRYALDLKAGVFRKETDAGPWTPALRSPGGAGLDDFVAGPPPPAQPGAAASAGAADRAAGAAFSALGYRADAGRSVVGVLPIDVRVPQFGLCVFAAAELIEESRAPVLEFDYKRVNGR